MPNMDNHVSVNDLFKNKIIHLKKRYSCQLSTKILVTWLASVRTTWRKVEVGGTLKYLCMCHCETCPPGCPKEFWWRKGLSVRISPVMSEWCHNIRKNCCCQSLLNGQMDSCQRLLQVYGGGGEGGVELYFNYLIINLWIILYATFPIFTKK